MQQEANALRQEITYLKGILNTQKQDASTQTYNVALLRLTKVSGTQSVILIQYRYDEYCFYFIKNTYL